MVPTSWQDEALARDGVSREVPCSALKCEKGPDSLHATPKSSSTRRVPSRVTPRVPAPLHLSPFSPPDGDRRVDPPELSVRLPGLPGIPQDVAGLTRKFETSPVGGPTCRKTPISLSALKRTRGPDTSSKATQWVKAQHEGALSPSCIVRKHPQVPHTAEQGA